MKDEKTIKNAVGCQTRRENVNQKDPGSTYRVDIPYTMIQVGYGVIKMGSEVFTTNFTAFQWIYIYMYMRYKWSVRSTFQICWESSSTLEGPFQQRSDAFRNSEWRAPILNRPKMYYFTAKRSCSFFNWIPEVITICLDTLLGWLLL